MLQPFISFFILSSFAPLISASSYLNWNVASRQQIEKARLIGVKARNDYQQASRSVHTSAKDRHALYLDGIRKCNSIDDDLIVEIDQNIVQRNHRQEDAVILEKIGFNKFFAQFVTLSMFEMVKVVNFACAKHEQQLECGYYYEGKENTDTRISELMQDGGNRQMFEHECVQTSYATSVYPCLADTSRWVGPCQKEINEYSLLRGKVNRKIENSYEKAIATIKYTKEEKEQVFKDTMRLITYIEGTKCLSFKKMRVCLLQQLLQKCGVDAARALNTSISTGYLATERSERLQADFQTFEYPVHPFCEKL